MMRYIENPGIFRTVYSDISLAYSEQFIQTFPGIFRDFQKYSATFSVFKAYRGIFRCWYIEVYSVIFRILCNPCIYNRIIFRTLAHLDPQASSKACGTRKMIRYIQSPGIIRTVFSSIFKGYLVILSVINAYSATPTGAQLGVKGSSPLSFFENQKKCFGKKALLVCIFALHFQLKM